MASEAPLSFISLLSEGCQESGCSVFGGGGVHLGGTLETYGNTNVANSLLAIEELVFNKKILSLEEMIRALDANFVGHEELLKQCQEIPKYGNDNQQADAMAKRVHDHVCNFTRNQAKKVGLDSYMVVVINNWANTVLGYQTGASAEGRLAGKHMANGNNPTPGSDRSGVTAFLNSLSKLDPTIHAGAVQNMKFSKEWFGSLRPKFEALLKTYFAKGGTQAMITVLNRQDLESAMKEPEKWTSLLVRVGGFSIRFIDLPKKAQQEILERTLH
jgi:pyruvate-formate lyase